MDDEDYSSIAGGDDGWCEQDLDGEAVGCDGVIDDGDSQSEDEVEVDFPFPDDVGEHDGDDAGPNGPASLTVCSTAPALPPKRDVLGTDGRQARVQAAADDDDDANEQEGGSDEEHDADVQHGVAGHGGLDDDERELDEDYEEEEEELRYNDCASRADQEEEDDDVEAEDNTVGSAAALPEFPKPSMLRESPLTIVSLNRRQHFGLIGSMPSPFAGAEVWTNPFDDQDWRVRNVGGHWFAVEEPLPGDAVQKTSWGPAAERLLWVIHSLVMTSKLSLIVVADRWLGEMIWGKRKPRKHWLGYLRHLLEGLTRLHVAPRTGLSGLRQGQSQLLSTVQYLKSGGSEATCGECCPCHGTNHGHFVVETGPRFLGVLELLGTTYGGRTRRYDFSFEKPKRSRGVGNARQGKEKLSLRTIGKKAPVTSAFLPAKLGEPAASKQFNPSQHRIIQALISETTRTAGPGSDGVREAEGILVGSVVPFSGRGRTRCPLLDPQRTYVGFNGNGRRPRRARGYKVASEKGWMFKAGYPIGDAAEVIRFLDDLNCLREPLALSVVGVGRGPADWYSLDQLRGLAATPQGRFTLARLTVRVYADADYLQRWAAVFNWTTPVARAAAAAMDSAAAVVAAVHAANVTVVELANGLGRKPDYLYKIFQGKKPFAAGLRTQVQEYLAYRAVTGPATHTAAVNPDDAPGPESSALDQALAYHRLGWNVIPMRMGEKRPYLPEWRSLQTRRVTEAEVHEWWEKWPEAGIALVLGPISGVMAIDSDGPPGRAALLEQLGAEPTTAPRTISGSTEPDHFHLLFRCPAVPTRAKFTPWHKKLEFRGQGGLVVLPYSTHPSGRKYKWAAGRSPWELPLSLVPDKVLEALRGKRRDARPTERGMTIVDSKALTADVLGRLGRSTRRFLAGEFAEAVGEWNDRLFRAACDMHARRVPIGLATRLLLAGARPAEAKDERIARATIESAYSQPRVPSES